MRDFLLNSVVPRLAHHYMNFVGATSRLTWHGDPESVTLAEGNKDFIYALWHGRQVFLTYTHRGRGIRTLVSRSKDGEMIAEVIRLSGNKAVRGSSSRGGVAALKELIDEARAGFPVCVTPDGPRGPFRTVKHGVLFLARELGLPIIAGNCGMKRKIVIRNWDEIFFPLPFNRIAVAYAPPIRVGPDDDLDKKAEELRLALNASAAEADRQAEL